MNLGLSSYHYKPKTILTGKPAVIDDLRERIERMQEEFTSYGYRRLGQQPRGQGLRSPTNGFGMRNDNTQSTSDLVTCSPPRLITPRLR